MNNPKEVRSAFYDNAKAILIFTVIAGHLIEMTLPDFETLWKFIYLFHMPCFVFISGYFSKKGIATKRVFAQYVSLVIVFQIFYYLIEISSGTPVSLREFFTVPYILLWYLLSLGCWVLLLNVIDEKYLFLIIVLSFVIAIISGASVVFGRTLSIGRSFYFLPFFLLGYYIKLKNASDQCFNNKKIKTVSCFLLAVFVICLCSGAIKLPYPIQAYYGRVSFKTLNMPIGIGILSRITTLCMSLMLSFVVLNVIPKKRTFYTRLGDKTLTVYLLHYAFVLLFGKVILSKIHPYHNFILPFIIIYAILIYAITANSYLNSLILKIPIIANKIMDIRAKRILAEK